MMATIGAIIFSGGIAYAQQRDTSDIKYSIDNAAVITSSLPIMERGNSYIYSMEKAAGVISVIGEPDVMRQLATLPGVSFGMEGSLALFVRGGNSNNCRLSIDGVPIYNATHALGLFSSVSPEIVSSARLYTGGFSAMTGDYTAGLVQTNLRRSSVDELYQSYSVSPYIEGAYMEVPGRLSLKVAVRYSPIFQIADFLTKNYPHLLGGSRATGNMYDLCAGISYEINGQNSLSASAFITRDNLDLNLRSSKRIETFGSDAWMAKLAWHRKINDKLRMDVLGYVTSGSSYDNQTLYKENAKGEAIVTSGYLFYNEMTDINAKMELYYEMSEKTKINGGVELLYRFDKLLPSIYGEIEHRHSDILTLKGGLRHSLANCDIHALADVRLNRNFGIEFCYDKTSQYFHVLEGTPTGCAMNLMVPVSDDYPEEVANQFYVGVYSAFRFEGGDYLGTVSLNANIGAYYKAMENLVSYTSMMNFFKYDNRNWWQCCDLGTGTSYGVETSVSLNTNTISFNGAYTYSKTDRTFPMMNRGETFPFQFDRPHIINSQLDVRTFKSQRAMMIVTYSSGSLMTLALRQYDGAELPHFPDLTAGYQYEFLSVYNNLMYNRWEMTSYNGFRLPANFRIDVGYSFEFHRKKSDHELTISIYNVLNRHNPFLIYNDTKTGKWKQLSILPILPSIRWKMEF